MRPALIRLLKRPSTLSIIETLVTTSIGLDQLGPQYTSVRCHSQPPKRRTLASDSSHNSIREARPRRSSRESNLKTSKLPASARQICGVDPEKSQHASSGGQQIGIDDPVLFLRANPERLEFESDIGHNKDIGTRLVDHPEHRNNFGLWAELLRYRQGRYGETGSQTIWEGMTMRVGEVRLPIMRDHADFLWQKFVELGLERVVFLEEIMRHAFDVWRSEGRYWPNLYESVVGGLLNRGSTTQAVYWHNELLKSGLAVSADIVKIIAPAISPACQTMYQALPGHDSQLSDSRRRQILLKALCERSEGGLYGAVILKLLEHGYGVDALAMHTFLVKHEDHPATIQDIQPLMDFLAKYGVPKGFERFHKDYESLQAYYDELFDPAELEDEFSGVAPSPSKATFPKDDLGTRLFATRALSFEMVLGTLKLMGVTLLGPRALREMALKYRDPHELREKLKSLEEAKISIGDSVFSRLVQKFAAENRGMLLHILLEADQHPDTLEDKQLQERLLVSYYIAPDWDLYNLSLAILEQHHPKEPELWNIHFRKFLAAGDLTAASRVVDEMAVRSQSLSGDSIELLASSVLKPRMMQKRPTDGPGLSTSKQVKFIFGIFKRMVPIGSHVNEKLWIEMLRRLGKTRRMGMMNWKDLRECCLWLVHQYAGHGQQRQSHKSQLQSQTFLRTVFHHYMQAAIVTWGFQWQLHLNSPVENQYFKHPSSGESLIPFVRGIALLQELEQAGLPIDLGKVRYAVRLRLQQLYGYYHPSRKRINRTARRTNPFSVQQILGDIDRAWGRPFWPEEPSTSQELEKLVNPKRRPLLQPGLGEFRTHIPRSMCVGRLSFKRAAR